MQTQNNVPAPGLLAKLNAYLADKEVSKSQFARDCNVSQATISKYCSATAEKPYVGDLVKLEGIIADVLLGAERRASDRVQLFPTQISNEVNAVCETVKDTSDIGLIYGAAGLGKTCAIDLYLTVNPSAIKITATERTCDGESLLAALFAAVDTNKYNHTISRFIWLSQRFAKSNRLIIVDNANRIRQRGWEFLFDFYDATECPLMLIGNPELKANLSKNDQWFSRIGYQHEVKLRGKAASEIAAKMVDQFVPDAPEILATLVDAVIEHRGGVRAAKKQLKLAKRISHATRVDIVTGFKAAHKKLIRDFELEAA